MNFPLQPVLKGADETHVTSELHQRELAKFLRLLILLY